MSDKAKWGYLAGMVDGKGHISISKGSTPAKNGNGYMTSAPRYNLIVAVTGTNENLMQWLVANFGGSWSQSKNKNKPNWKPKLTWVVGGLKNKEHILLGILPYLVIKRNQAILGLDFIRLTGIENPAKREEIRGKLLELNKKGKIVEANTLDLPSQRKVQYRPPELEPALERMRESGLIGNDESAPTVM
jgi:hypothetical protein